MHPKLFLDSDESTLNEALSEYGLKVGPVEWLNPRMAKVEILSDDQTQYTEIILSPSVDAFSRGPRVRKIEMLMVEFDFGTYVIEASPALIAKIISAN